MITGNSIGTVNNIILILSIKHPNKRRSAFIISNTIIGSEVRFPNKAIAFWGTCIKVKAQA